MRVRGSSLAPRYQDGDFVILSGLGLKRIRPGDVVVFDQPGYGRLIKCVESIEPCGHLRVRGTDVKSADSLEFGPVPRSAVRGKVIAHIKK